MSSATKDWRAKNAEHVKAYKRSYYQTHKETFRVDSRIDSARSQGRAIREEPPAPKFVQPISSYCFICSHWHYGIFLLKCSRCMTRITCHVPDSKLAEQGGNKSSLESW